MTAADRTRAERVLAFLACQIRTDWDEHGVLVILRRCSEKPIEQVAAAVLHCAVHRTDQRTPECIARPGEHWGALDRMAGRVGTTRGPDERCAKHGQHLPCMACEAEARGPAISPERMREIRAQCRREAS